MRTRRVGTSLWNVTDSNTDSGSSPTAAPDHEAQALALVEEWLPLPDVAEQTGLGISKVRRLVEDRALIGFKHGSPKVFQVPALFIDGDAPVKNLHGTLVLLADAGFGDAEAIAWLFTADDTLPGRPIDVLRSGSKKEVRRRAQALAV
nr:Rv2175c family DNA-binding protein [Brevibacterium otitidis]